MSIPRSTLGVGVVVPPANPVVEDEVRAFTGQSVRWHTARLPVIADPRLERRNAGYLAAIPEMAGCFGGMALDGLYVACTGCHYGLAPEQDVELYRQASQAAGFPVRSATLLVGRALRELGARRLHLVSPYEPWLTEQTVGYWERSGFAVDSVVHARRNGQRSPYDVDARQLCQEVERAGLPDDAVVVFSGTGVPCDEAMTELTRGTRRTALSANLCGAWWATTLTDGTGSGAHPLLDRLRAQLAARGISAAG